MEGTGTGKESREAQGKAYKEEEIQYGWKGRQILIYFEIIYDFSIASFVKILRVL